MNCNDPLKLLIEVIEGDDGRLSVEASQWFRHALMKHMETGESLEYCLRLKEPWNTGQSVVKQYQYRKRNQYIAEALVLLEARNIKSPAKQLAKEVIRFDRRVLPRLQFQDRQPESFSELDMLLFRVFDTGLNIPESAHGLSTTV